MSKGYHGLSLKVTTCIWPVMAHNGLPYIRLASLARLQLAMVGRAWLRASSQWLGHRSWPRGAWNHMVAFQGIVHVLREWCERKQRVGSSILRGQKYLRVGPHRRARF